MDKRIQRVMNDPDLAAQVLDMLGVPIWEELRAFIAECEENITGGLTVEDTEKWTAEQVWDYVFRMFWDEMMHGYLQEHIDQWKNDESQGYISGISYLHDCFYAFKELYE